MRKNIFGLSLVIFVLCLNLIGTAQVANFIANPTYGCGSAIVQFTNTSTGFTSSSWDFGNGNTSGLPSPSATYNTPGTYTVTLTVSNGSTSDTLVKTNYITVYTNPSAAFSITPDSACVGSTITFNSTSTQGTGGPINHYLWTFGDGSLDSTSGANPTHSYNSQGNFPINLVVTDQHGCNSTIVHNAVTLNGPTANFTPSQVSACNAPVTVNFTNTTTGSPTGYLWNFGDPSSGANNISTNPSPSHTFNAAGTYIVKLTALSPGCNSVHLFTFQVLQTTAAFTQSDTAICFGGSVSFTNHTVPSNATYSWNFGDPSSGANNVSFVANPSHLFMTAGFHTVTVSATANGCTNSTTHTVHVRSNPTPSITATPSVGCLVPLPVAFNVPTGNIASWQWNFNDPSSGANNTSTLQSPSHTFNAFGSYHPSVTVIDSFGCTGTAFFNTVNIQPPSADFSPSTIDSGCVPLLVNFTNMSTSIDPITQFSWNFGDPASGALDSASSANASHTYNSVGTFTVTLIIHTQGGCVDTIIKPAWVRTGTHPNADFTWNPDTVCFGQSVTFTSVTPQPVTGWKWDFGDGGGSQGSPTATHTYNIDTATIVPFTVTMIAYYNGCPDTMIHHQIITVLLPVPDFTPIHSCSTPYTITFQNTSRGATGQTWDFGDTTALVTSVSPVHTYAHRGTFTVTLTDTNSTTGCSYFKMKTVQITDPKAHFTASDTGGCFHHPITFTNASQDANAQFPLQPYSWNFGDPASGFSNTSAQQSPTHIYNSPGIYTIHLTVTDMYGCTNDSSIKVHILGPYPSFTATPTFGCSPLDVTFIDTSHVEGGSAVTRIWTFATATAPVTVLNDSVNHIYNLPNSTAYTVKLRVIDSNGCTDSLTKPLYILVTHPAPTLSFGDTVACPGELILDTITSGNNAALPVKYVIDYGDLHKDSITSASTIAYFSHTYSSLANGVYHVTVKVTDANGCDSVITRNLSILKPNAAFNISSNYICTSSANSPDIQVTNVNVSFTDQSTGLTGSGNHWYWDCGNSPNILQSQNLSAITYTLPGNYSPQLIVTNGAGCSDTLKRTDLINVPGPVGLYTFSPLTGCHPLTVNFTGATTGGGIFYSWDFGDGYVLKNVPDTVVSHTYHYDGTYHPFFYIGYVQPNGVTCSAVGKNPTTDTLVIVKTYITVDIDSSFIVLNEGQQTTVHASVFDTTAFGGPPFTYAWIPSADVSSSGSSAVISGNNPSDSAYYYCTVTNVQGCQATDSLRVMIIPCDSKSIIPNVFTPNGDDFNDTYYIDNLCPGAAFHFTIYNRWGTIIYESNDSKFHWNGKTTGGNDASEGTYYYICKTRKSELHGFIQLIRK